MSKDPDAKKGAVAQDRPEQKTNTSLSGQNPHREKGPALEGRDSDFPERGENEEHSMEGHTQRSRFGGDPGQTQEKKSPEGVLNDQDPGERQKRNQNDQREDPLAG
jgi:hypothetical protein